MIITMQAKPNMQLKGKKFYTFDTELRAKYPDLLGWTYRHSDGELMLDFGDTEEEQLTEKLKARIKLVKSEGKFLKASLLDKEFTNEDASPTTPSVEADP